MSTGDGETHVNRPLAAAQERLWPSWPARLRSLALSLLLAAGCTPISEHRASTEATEKGSDSGQGRPSPDAAADTEEGGKTITGEPAKSGAKSGAKAGSEPCESLAAGDLYCDADAKMHVCLTAESSRPAPCGADERCVVVAGRAKCGCVPGAVLVDSRCVAGTNCSVENGGCDPLTDCMPAAGGRTCGDCPGGHVGDGLQGCVPQFVTLTPSCGALAPPLAAGVYDYRLAVPLSCQALSLELSVPMNARIVANGEELSGVAASWPLAPIKYGATVLPFVVTSGFGVSAKYTLNVERSGAQEAYLKASNADAEDKLGFSLATHGDQVFASAPWEDSASVDQPADNAAANSGAVYGFGRQNGGWAQTSYLKANPVVAGEWFGVSVAAEGDTLVIGAPSRDPLEWYGGSGLGTRAGAVYVFTLRDGTWIQTARLTTSSSTVGDMFGYKVALRGDILLIGAPGDNANGVLRSGAAYIFQREGGTWVEKHKLQAPSALESSMFGLSLFAGEEQIVIGAPNESGVAQKSGAAYVFEQQAGIWQMVQRLEARAPQEGATFGWQVGFYGDELLVSSPSVVRIGPPGELSIFERNTGSWVLMDTKSAAYPAAADLFGGAIALTDSMMVVGANGDSSGAAGIEGDASRTDVYQSGAVYLYARSGMNWTPTTYVKPSNPDASDFFGQSIAVSADQTIFVAASYESGASRKINGDASTNSVSHSGAVYVFR